LVNLLLASLLAVVLAQSPPPPPVFTLQVVGYQFLPDLAGDGLVGLSNYIANKFHADTGFHVNIVYDETFTLDTYNPPSIVAALSSGGGYHMAEIDTITLGYFLNVSGLLQSIPSAVNFDNFLPASLAMVKGFPNSAGVVKNYGHPSFSCTNVLYSYVDSIDGVHSIAELLAFIKANKKSTTQMGWATDIGNNLDLRLEYVQGYLGSHPTTPLFPSAYSNTTIDSSIIADLVALRDQCNNTKHSGTVNKCTDCTYYNNFTDWFDDFASGKILTLQGFPEYFSDILATNNVDVNNPTIVPFTGPAIAGAGDRPYAFTDAFVLSTANCGSGACLSAVTAWLNWQRTNYAQIASLGLDLSPVRPRFLAVANGDFYYSNDVYDLPLFARDHYAFTSQQISKAIPLETLHFWANEATASQVIANQVLQGYPDYSGGC